MKKRIDMRKDKSIAMRKLFRLLREESGVELVEFAMTAWILILLLLGVFGCAYAAYAYHFTTYAAEQGARFAMVRGETWSENISSTCTTTYPGFTMPYSCTAQNSNILNYVQSLATPGINPSNISINSSNWPGTTPCTSDCSSCATPKNPGCNVVVTVTYNFYFVPYLKMSEITMNATAEKVILQ
jgi:Flp pilus assembly protein TadG